VEVADDGMATFRRETFREVAYAQLTFKRRRHLHTLAGRAIERDPSLAFDARRPMLSLHFARAMLWPEAYEYSRQAAGSAQERHANVAVVEFLERAIDAARKLAVEPDELAGIYVAMGDAMRITGRDDGALRAYGSARRLVTDPAQRAGLFLKAAYVHSD